MRLVLLVAMLLVPGVAWANTDSPLTYIRTNIVILRASAPAIPEPEKKEASLPWQEEETPEAAPATPGVVFDVEVRDASVMYNQSGWYDLSGVSDQHGLLLMFDHPGIAPISPSSQYAPLDILMVDEQGVINQIVPNLVMSQMVSDILPSSPVKAFLFLKGGTCSAMNIQPGDRVLYKQFRQPPTVLSAPPKADAAPSPVPAPASVVSQPQPAVPRAPLLEQPAQDEPFDESLIPDGLLSAEDLEGAGPITQESPAQIPKRRSSGPLMVPVD